MNPKFITSQLVFFAGIFLLINFVFFVPAYYSYQFDSNVCDMVDKPGFTGAGEHSQEYYQNICDSVIVAWKAALEPPITVRYHVIPILVAGLLTAVYSYYLMLNSDYESHGWPSDD